jgi:hypothetical protein
MTAFIGFYWTLPVPWAGHLTLPPEAAAAAAQSQTIRYQRDIVRHWARANGGRVIAEHVFMELAPDRGSPDILPEVAKALARCHATGARLLVVDMAACHGWRSHRHLAEALDAAGDTCQRLYPDEILIDGQRFDPAEHFRKWRAAQRDFIGSKDERMARARAAAAALYPRHPQYRALAEALNAEGHRSASGSPWTAESLRKFLGQQPPAPDPSRNP